MRANHSKQSGPDPGDPVERLQRSEWTTTVPVGHDALGQGQPHPGEPGQLLSGGRIGIDFLPRPQRAVRRLGGLSVSSGGAARDGTKKLDVSWSRIGPGDEIAHGLAGHGQGEQDQNGPSLGGHGPV